MKNLIIDLEGNGGGYLNAAVDIASELIEENKLVVYTEGRSNPRYEYMSKGKGKFLKGNLVVIVDETSASASEIIAGTIQDNDRGTVIGRRTFGKGLVQKQIDLRDGSVIRLTIARYHTPSGRCIQKPYTKGDGESYAMDLIDRYERGEFFSQDSIHQNEELIYTTKGGRTVYGGGGIMPDIFVSSDTTDVTSYVHEVVSKGVIAQYALKYSTANRPTLSQYKDYNSLLVHLEREPLLDNLVQFAQSKGIKPRYNLIETSREILEKSLYSNIIYQILGMQEHVKFINLTDPTVLKAVEILEKGKSRPTENIKTALVDKK
jgi:carboxyl-terminal processing protease